MTAESLVLVGGALLALLVEFVPGFSGIWTKFTPVEKRASMAGLLALGTAGALLLSCFGPYDFFACTEAGIWGALELFVLAVLGSQGMHSLVKKEGF
jgi:hypothetical protein